MPRRFEFTDDKSAKFWEIELDGSSFTVRFGRLGTDGQTQAKSFDSAAKALKEHDKLVAEKLGKGYVEQRARKAAAGAKSAKSAAPVKTVAKPAPAAPAARKSTVKRPADPVLPRDVDALTGLEPALPSVVEDLYLVNDHITPVPEADIDKLEAAIGSLPFGYRDLMRRCGGKGMLFDEMKVWTPDVIIGRVEKDRSIYGPYIADLRRPRGLTEQDIKEFWPFAGDQNGNKWIYCPRHPGVLFERPHGGYDIIRCPHAFRRPGKLFEDGKFDFDFPFFVPQSPSRQLKSYELKTKRTTEYLSKWAETWWRKSGGEVRRMRMPAKFSGDSVTVFVRRIGGSASFVHEAQNDPTKVYGGIDFDKPFAAEADAFLKALHEQAE